MWDCIPATCDNCGYELWQKEEFEDEMHDSIITTTHYYAVNVDLLEVDPPELLKCPGCGTELSRRAVTEDEEKS